MIEDKIGVDKETIRSYKGYSGHIRPGRCGDNQIVGLSRKGYLERFGFLRRTARYHWTLCQEVLLSQSREGVGVVSNEKIFISAGVGGCGVEGSVLSLVSASSLTPVRDGVSSSELEEEESTEKDRFFTPKIRSMIGSMISEEKQRNVCPKISPMISAEKQEDPALKWLRRVATAKQSEETSKARVEWSQGEALS